MKILLTGGSGYLGRNFIAKYKNKYDITAPTSEEADLTNIASVSALFKNKKYDAVLHFAGKSESNAQTLVEADNLIMFKNVQYMSILYGVQKLIITGDAAEFDRARPIVDVTENEFGQSVPTDAYGLGRYLVRQLASKDKISTSLRFFSVYGGDMSPSNNKLTEIIARGITGKKVIQLDGDKVFSTIYIDDAIKIIASFVDNDFPNGDYNVVCNDKASYLSAASIVKKLAKKNGRDLEIKSEGNMQNEMSGKNDKLMMVLPTFKFTSFNSGINKTYEFLNAHKGILRAKKQ